MKQFAVVVAALAAVALSGCEKEGCLNGEPDCKVPSPCSKVSFTCDAALSELYADLKERRTRPINRRRAHGGVSDAPSVARSARCSERRETRARTTPS